MTDLEREVHDFDRELSQLRRALTEDERRVLHELYIELRELLAYHAERGGLPASRGPHGEV